MLVSGDEIVRTRSGSALDDLVIRGVGLNHREAFCWRYCICKLGDFHARFFCFGWRPPEFGLQHALNFIQTSRIAADTSSRMAPALAASSKRKGTPPNSKALTYTLLSRVTENT
jgi:hypothetical protein